MSSTFFSSLFLPLTPSFPPPLTTFSLPHLPLPFSHDLVFFLPPPLSPFPPLYSVYPSSISWHSILNLFAFLPCIRFLQIPSITQLIYPPPFSICLSIPLSESVPFYLLPSFSHFAFSFCLLSFRHNFESLLIIISIPQQKTVTITILK